ncbi:DUF983 domain-containing protein [Roseivivax isoporae]|uniref:Cytochrome C oxidase subunit III n=1 Tax=Roseivivax isoporae LMG 25204 TaxID=1449351 RepID=X7F956_9RHOB|nr:DUF983 domain-containing protein [Roseivivax isoporae]ETX29432.1 cytochrome C oxidase subunit III [Roseivivax isoporae LMG 25204]
MTTDDDPRDARLAMRRGLLGRCPNCGTGRLFEGYLGVAARCAACGEPLGAYKTADAPAFFTISIVGLLLIPLFGIGFAVFRPEPVVLLLWITGITLVLTFALLRLIKGATVGYFWAQKERDRGS